MTRLHRLLASAQAMSSRNFALLACSSLIATGAVVGGSLSSTGLGDPAALAAALASRSAATDPAAATDTSTAAAGPAASSPSGPGPGPSNPAPTSAPPTEAPPATDPTTPDDPSQPSDPSTPDDPGTNDPPSPFGHVFVISLASPGYDRAFGTDSEMPYLSGKLRPRGSLIENYSLLSPNPLPNQIAMVSGQRPNAVTSQDCRTYREFPTSAAPDSKGFVDGDGCVYPVLALSVADQIAATGVSWHAYVEDMADDTGKAANCVHPVAGEEDTTQGADPPADYQTPRNPFVYFHSLLDLGSCSSNDVPLDDFGKDLKKESSTPSYSFIAPDTCHSGAVELCADGTDGVKSEDDFLSKLVPKILASEAYGKDGLLIVTFGEEGPTYEGTGDQVGTLVVSNLSTPGGTISGDFDPYSLLRTTEDIFGATPLAAASSASSFAGDLVTSGD